MIAVSAINTALAAAATWNPAVNAPCANVTRSSDNGSGRSRAADVGPGPRHLLTRRLADESRRST